MMNIKNFEQYNESLRDYMKPKDEKYIQDKINDIMDGDSLEIVENLFEEFRKDDIDYYEFLSEFVTHFDYEFVKEKSIELIKKNLKKDKDKIIFYLTKLVNYEKVNLYKYLDIVYDQLYETEYMFVQLMEDLIELYDPEEIKKFVLKELKNKYDI